jgi:hypothetical protein
MAPRTASLLAVGFLAKHAIYGCSVGDYRTFDVLDTVHFSVAPVRRTKK